MPYRDLIRLEYKDDQTLKLSALDKSMNEEINSNKKTTTTKELVFLWALGLLVGFPVLYLIINAIFGRWLADAIGPPAFLGLFTYPYSLPMFVYFLCRKIWPSGLSFCIGGNVKKMPNGCLLVLVIAVFLPLALVSLAMFAWLTK